MAILEVDSLRLYYSTERGPVRAVDDVSFTIGEGEALGVVGESGCGKTSLASALMRLLPRNLASYSGSVKLDGEELMRLSDEEFRSRVRWKKMAMVFQGAMNSLNPVLRVGFQVAEPLIASGGSGEEAKRTARELLHQVGLPPEVYGRFPNELSGGMKQRAVIAMSLVLSPALLILDEPTSALDVSVQAQVMNLLKRLKRERKISALFITHDIALASDICDRFAVLYSGQIVELGDADDILIHPKHPYTQKLLSSTPRLRSESEPEFIPGVPPDLVNPPSGCRFRPRCPYAFEPCTRDPPIYSLSASQASRCWLHQSPP
ncbi:MAG: ABC transporter ATP-binding protein [Thaumarchaeota archaeon]|nr:ABC transporter ATP-binding protein [Nitrososphaerota archaeon]